jgi:hypothetical protein
MRFGGLLANYGRDREIHEEARPEAGKKLHAGRDGTRRELLIH